MRFNDFNRPYRFSFLLPYGYATPQALELSMVTSDMPFLPYDPDVSMDERMDICAKAHRNRLEVMHSMEKYGYIEKVTFKYGSKDVEKMTVYRLTKAGFYVLTGTFDEEFERRRQKEAGQDPIRVRNGTSYQVRSDEEYDTLNMLNYLAGKSEEDAWQEFVQEAEFAVKSGLVSPLAYFMDKAPDVQVKLSTKGEIRCRNTRLANVNALFMANGFLTVLDRLPMDCVIPVWDIYDSQNLPRLDVEMFTFFARYMLFRDYPYSYNFLRLEEDDSDKRYEQWVGTPVFYPLNIIPGFDPFAQDLEFKYRKVRRNFYHHTCLGVAAGTKANYLVYHARPTSLPWKPSLEDASREQIKCAIENLHKTNPHPHSEKSNSFALIICQTLHQFKALFRDAQKRMGKKKGSKRQVDLPYLDVCIVPMNHSGLEQIRMLMYSTPPAVEMGMMFKLKGMNEEFIEIAGTEFPLAYCKAPVLIAHTMNFQKLFRAMEYCETGKKLYVSCFPEQVPFLRTILPNAEFL